MICQHVCLFFWGIMDGFTLESHIIDVNVFPHFAMWWDSINAYVKRMFAEGLSSLRQEIVSTDHDYIEVNRSNY